MSLPPWEDFLDRLVSTDPYTLDRHFRPQAWFLYPFPGRFMVLDELTLLGLPVTNTSIHRGMDEFTPEQANAVAHYYGVDVALWRSVTEG